ncbi:MAG: right-handed parallel beta-helix repeat-containing protein, partial [Actinobacteria bacterium]|nr:right-handed parallel beta-helix repeat-containing protein [Actinomycetota bacterium]
MSSAVRRAGRGTGSVALLVLMATVASPVRASAATVINVPANQPSIQAAIDAASNGDEVVVGSGFWNENINFNGKAIEVRAAQPRGATISGGQRGPVVTFASGEGPAAVLRGFVISGGHASSEGGGARIVGASPTIVDNTFSDNAAVNGGGGIAVLNGSPVITRNHVYANSQTGGSWLPAGGGLLIRGASTAQVMGNGIGTNSSNGPGGGLALHDAGGPTIRDNVFAFNRSSSHGAG